MGRSTGSRLTIPATSRCIGSSWDAGQRPIDRTIPANERMTRASATAPRAIVITIPAVNVTKAKLEGLFVDELEQLQPTPGYMRLAKELVLRAWQERKAEVGREAADTERRANAIQQKLDRLDEAFLSRSQSTCRRTSGNETSCVRSSRSPISTDTPPRSKNST